MLSMFAIGHQILSKGGEKRAQLPHVQNLMCHLFLNYVYFTRDFVTFNNVLKIKSCYINSC